MNIREIFETIEKIGCLGFSTSDGVTIHARYARFFGYDDDGLYFMTMTVKPFYRQLIGYPKLAVCGIYPSGSLTKKDEHGMPVMQPGFTLRITGDIREIPYDSVQAKCSAGHEGFEFAIYDISRYPAMRVFCLYRGKGEIFDFDFEMQQRDYKLHRTRFSFGGESYHDAGCRITEDCSGCGACMEVCTFNAIEPGTRYRIIGERCDECGNCIMVCPEKAINESETI